MLDRVLRRIYYFLYLRLMGSYFRIADWTRARLFMKMTGKSVDGLVVRAGVYVSGYRMLSVGSNVSINHNCFLSCEGGLRIGNDVSIAHGVSILTTEHSFSDASVPIKFQPISVRPVTIGDNVWIGAKATILGGVELAKGTIVAAGAVVTRSTTSEDTIVGGVPARHIKHRLS